MRPNIVVRIHGQQSNTGRDLVVHESYGQFICIPILTSSAEARWLMVAIQMRGHILGLARCWAGSRSRDGPRGTANY
jgi:hypothetical protein